VVGKAIVVGYESGLERVDVLYSSLVMQMMGQILRVRPPSWSRESTRAYRLSTQPERSREQSPEPPEDQSPSEWFPLPSEWFPLPSASSKPDR
jgi:hypothetical protein